MSEPVVTFTKNTYSVRASSGDLKLTVDGIHFESSPTVSGGGRYTSEVISWKVIDELRKKLEEMEAKDND